MTAHALATFARTARKRMRAESGGYRRDHLRALAQRIEVDEKESSHHGVQERAPAHSRRRLKRKIGCVWSAQFCTEVARPMRFERLTVLGGPALRAVAARHLVTPSAVGPAATVPTAGGIRRWCTLSEN